MKFQKYNSIENSYRDKFLYQIQEQGLANGLWVVTEKIHGANFSLHYDGETFKAAKRSGFLGDNENFMGWFRSKAFWEEQIKDLYRDLKRYEVFETISFYGEIFGGSYPGQSIPNRATKVQKGVYYHPDNKILLFDIMIDGKYTGYNEFISICSHYGLPTVPELLIGTFTDCLNYSNKFITKVPEIFNLPEIEDNFCEGVVIKPFNDQYLTDGSRVILKNKNDKFLEKSHLPTEPKQTNILSSEAENVYQQVKTYITENRLRNVLSKIGAVGKSEFGKLLCLFSSDTFEDFQKDFDGLLEKIEKPERKLINKLVNSDIANLIRPNFINIVDGCYLIESLKELVGECREMLLDKFVFKTLEKGNSEWLEKEAAELKLQILSKRWCSKYNSYVVYDYEPFCSDGFEINVTVVRNQATIEYLKKLYDKRKDNITLLEKALKNTCDESKIPQLEKIPTKGRKSNR